MSLAREPTRPGTWWRDLLLSWPVLGIHGLALATPLLAPPTWGRIALLLAVYVGFMLAITAGYHRFFAHRSFRTSRAGQVVLAWAAQTTLQKGVLWWAAGHRAHHRHSDRAGDPHSPVRGGAWWGHLGWTLHARTHTEAVRGVDDWRAFPELVWLDRWWGLPAAVWVLVLGLIGGLPAIAWGFVLPVVLTWHATYCVNSVCHLWGTRRHDTPDGSRNNALVALITLGEGWHNEHHARPGSARQGRTWWQPDPTWWLLRILALVGLVWDLRR